MNIFITGGSSGMGAALALLYLKEGHRVGICGRSLERFTRAEQDIFSGHSSKLSFYQVDVSDFQALEKAVTQFLEGEKLDLMVASAGIPTGKKSRVPNFQVAENMLKINGLGVLNAFHVAFGLMRNHGGGQVVAFSSVAAYNGLPGVAPYSASKAYVKILCESFALDWQQFGIHVTCICPGFVDTPFTQINNHKMPFLMSAEKAANLIRNAIERKKFLYVFPWRMYLIVVIFNVIPRSVYRWIMKLKMFNYSS